MLKPRKNRESVGFESGDEYNEEINDKLNDLWTQMKHVPIESMQRKNEIIKTITPGYSRKIDNQNSFSVQMAEKSREVERIRQPDRLVSAEGEIIKLRDKLVMETAASKQKDVEISELKKHIFELTNDKKQVHPSLIQLLFELHNLSNLHISKGEAEMHNNQENSNIQNIKHELNESSIRKTDKKKVINPQLDEDSAGIESDTQRLLALLRSTEEYREFVFYYDNNELSFLRTLNKQRRRNCQCDPSEKQKGLWAPKDIIDLMEELNKRNSFGLDRQDIEKIVYNINLVYQQREKVKQSQIITQYQKKLRQAEREANHAIPYEILQIQKQKERELVGRKSKRVHSLASNK